MSLNKYSLNGEPPSSSPHDAEAIFGEEISSISLQSTSPFSYIPCLQSTPLPSYESVRHPSGNSSPPLSQNLGSGLSTFVLPGRAEHHSGSANDVFRQPSIDEGLAGKIIPSNQIGQYFASTSFLEPDSPSLAPLQDDSEDFYGTSPLANIAESFARLDQKKDPQPESVSGGSGNPVQQSLRSSPHQLEPERVGVKHELKIETTEDFLECNNLSQLQSPEPQQSMSSFEATPPPVEPQQFHMSQAMIGNPVLAQALRNFNIPLESSSSSGSSGGVQLQKAGKASTTLSLLYSNQRLLNFPERETLDYRDATGAVAALVSPSPLAPLAADLNRGARGGRAAQPSSLGGPSAEQVAGMAEGDAALPYSSSKRLQPSDEGSSSVGKKPVFPALGSYSPLLEQSPQVGAYGMSVSQYCSAEQTSPGNVGTSQPGPAAGSQHPSELLPAQYRLPQTLQHQMSPQQVPLQQISPQQIQHQLSPHQIQHHEISPQQIQHQQISPQQIPTQQVSPHQISPHQISPHQISPHQISPHQISPHQISPHHISSLHISSPQYFPQQMQQQLQRHQQLQQPLQQCMNVAQELSLGPHVRVPRRAQQIAFLGEDNNSITLSTDNSNHHQLMWAPQQQQQQPADVKMFDHYVVRIDDCAPNGSKRMKTSKKAVEVIVGDDEQEPSSYCMNPMGHASGGASGAGLGGEQLSFGGQNPVSVDAVALAAASLDADRNAGRADMGVSTTAVSRATATPTSRAGFEGVAAQAAYALALSNSDLASRNNNNNNNIVNKVNSYSSPSQLDDSHDDKEPRGVKRKAADQKTGRSTSVYFLCGICSVECKSRMVLRKHLIETHPNDTSDKEVLVRCECPVIGCNYTSTERPEFDNHMKKHLQNGFTPTGKQRSTQTPLQRHRYSKEELKCKKCTYKCVQQSAFIRHKDLHKLKIPIINFASCPFCGEDFREDADVRAHMNREHRSSVQSDSWQCMSCTFSSVQEKKLIQHLRMHTGEKPHLCSHCPYRAGRRDNLRSHVRRMHRENNLYADSYQPSAALLPDALEAEGKDDSVSIHKNEAINYRDGDNGDVAPNGNRNLVDSHSIVGLPNNTQEFEIDPSLVNLPYNVLDSFAGSGSSISAANIDSMMSDLIGNSPVVFDHQIMLPASSGYGMWTPGDHQSVSVVAPSSSAGRDHAGTSSMVDGASYGAHALQMNVQPIVNQINSQQISIQQINTQQINTQQIGTQQINTQQIGTQQINTQQIGTQQINTQKHS